MLGVTQVFLYVSFLERITQKLYSQVIKKAKIILQDELSLYAKIFVIIWNPLREFYSKTLGTTTCDERYKATRRPQHLMAETSFFTKKDKM